MSSEYVTGGNVTEAVQFHTHKHPRLDTILTTTRSTILLTGALSLTAAWLMGSTTWWRGYKLASTPTSLTFTQQITTYLDPDTTVHMYWTALACLIAAALLSLVIVTITGTNMRTRLFDVLIVPFLGAAFVVIIALPTLLGLMLQVGLNHINTPTNLADVTAWETTHHLINAPTPTFADQRTTYYVYTDQPTPIRYRITSNPTTINISADPTSQPG